MAVVINKIRGVKENEWAFNCLHCGALKRGIPKYRLFRRLAKEFVSLRTNPAHCGRFKDPLSKVGYKSIEIGVLTYTYVYLRYQLRRKISVGECKCDNNLILDILVAFCRQSGLPQKPEADSFAPNFMDESISDILHSV